MTYLRIILCFLLTLLISCGGGKSGGSASPINEPEGNNVGANSAPVAMLSPSFFEEEARLLDGSTTDVLTVVLSYTQFQSIGLMNPIDYSVSPALPSGLSLSIEILTTTTAKISLVGTPIAHTVADNFSFSLTFLPSAFIGNAFPQGSVHTISMNFIDPEVLVTVPLSNTTRDSLITLKSEITNWVLCHDPMLAPFLSSNTVFPCVNLTGQKIITAQLTGASVFADHSVIAGGVCLSGDLERCDEVGRSQDNSVTSDTYGAFFRSPPLVRNFTNVPTTEIYSRDAATGVLSYLLKTRDTIAAKKWMNFIVNNRKITWISQISGSTLFYNLCPMTPADRINPLFHPGIACVITADFWGLFAQVWDYLGLRNSIDTPFAILAEMSMGSMIDLTALEISASTAPLNFQSQLIMYNILIRRAAGQSHTSIGNATTFLVDRSAYKNPTYTYLKYGKNELGGKQILEMCPSTRPDYGSFILTGQEIISYQLWSHPEWLNTITTYNYYGVPMGWDCLMLINYFLTP